MDNVSVDAEAFKDDNDYSSVVTVSVTLDCNLTSGQLRSLCEYAGIEVTDLASIHTAVTSLLSEAFNNEMPVAQADLIITVI
jgi:hypothetical protein